MKQMIPAADTHPATDMAARLAVIEYRIHEHMANAAGHLLGIGQCLNEAKSANLVPHGEWEAWVAKNTGFTVRQAQRMMNAARQVPEGSTLAQLPFTKIQACLQLPSADAAEAMAQRAQQEGMSLRQLQEEVKREKQRADQMADASKKADARAADAEKQLRDLQRSIPSIEATAAELAAGAVAQEVESLRRELAEAQQAGSVADGISPQAQAEIDRLRADLEEAETAIEQQAELRQQAQQELLNMKMQTARDGSAAQESGLTAFDLAAAVRTFIGSVGVLPHMGAALASAPNAERQQVLGYVDMVAEWVQGARNALRVVYVESD